MDQNPNTSSSKNTQKTSGISSSFLAIILGFVFFAVVGIILLISAFIFSNKNIEETEDVKEETVHTAEESTETTETANEEDETTFGEDPFTPDAITSEIDRTLEEINNALTDLDSSLEETDTPPTF